MSRVVVFAGTTEGYALCRFLIRRHIPVLASVATEYGRTRLEEDPFLQVEDGRLEEAEMEALLERETPEVVVDATHPYACQVSENISRACGRLRLPCLRVLREEAETSRGVVYVEDLEACIAYLENTQGNILLTTGSKELQAFTALTDYRERLYARVLSLPSVLERCREMGLVGPHLIGMQGPFSQAMNEATLEQYQCRFLVTKDTGEAGGFWEKLRAAQNQGAVAVVIGRPRQEEGVSLLEAKGRLCRQFSLPSQAKITLAGVGMGGEEQLTVGVQEALQRADLVIGAGRMLALARPGQQTYQAYDGQEIFDYIQEHPGYEDVLVLYSGDVGFSSGAKKLLELLPQKPEILCGISSPVYFFSRLGIPWEDACLVSAHGRQVDLVSLIREKEKVFAILKGPEDVQNLARSLTELGLGEVILAVGEDLSYPQEKIIRERAASLTQYRTSPLAVVCAFNPSPRASYATHGLPDGSFTRGRVPMTKEEIRTLSLAKLRLPADALCYDIGAGTGSLSVEMALRVPKGRVYGVEKNPEGVALIRENGRRFALGNLTVVEGEAPEALEGLPAPTHVFIGGSSGSLPRILDRIEEKSSAFRLVVNCITLETLGQVLEEVKRRAYADVEILQAAISKARPVGPYHMMQGENPIFIVACQKRTEGERG